MGQVASPQPRSLTLRLKGTWVTPHPARSGAGRWAGRIAQSGGTGTPAAQALAPTQPLSHQPGRARRAGAGPRGPLPSPPLLLVKQNQSWFYCLIFVTQTEVS